MSKAGKLQPPAIQRWVSAQINLGLYPSLDECWGSGQVNFRETAEGGGGILDITMYDPVNGSPRFRIPHCALWTDDEVRFWPANQPLNEFGYLYVALFIAGNYTRYFPDKWLADVESSTPLAIAIEELTELAEWRVPWLCLCELARNCYVLRA